MLSKMVRTLEDWKKMISLAFSLKVRHWSAALTSTPLTWKMFRRPC